MTYEALCYGLIIWLQITHFAECLSKDSVERFLGMVMLCISTSLLFTLDWWVK